MGDLDAAADCWSTDQLAAESAGTLLVISLVYFKFRRFVGYVV